MYQLFLLFYNQTLHIDGGPNTAGVVPFQNINGHLWSNLSPISLCLKGQLQSSASVQFIDIYW